MCCKEKIEKLVSKFLSICLCLEIHTITADVDPMGTRWVNFWNVMKSTKFDVIINLWWNCTFRTIVVLSIVDSGLFSWWWDTQQFDCVFTNVWLVSCFVVWAIFIAFKRFFLFKIDKFEEKQIHHNEKKSCPHNNCPSKWK